MILIAKDCNLIIHSPKIIHRFYCDEIHDDKINFQIRRYPNSSNDLIFV